MQPASARYDAEYYAAITDSGRSSAAVIAPILAGHANASSVVDVGCGHGYFLDAFRDHGVPRRLGIDGPFNDGLAVEAGDHEFRTVDLQNEALGVEAEFDLAICLEVAEHLHSEHAETLVQGLVEAAPVVAFSAGVPHQRGDGHVNLRRQSHWASLFARHGYAPTDLVRPVVWADERVSWWYAQNLLVYERVAGGPTIPIVDAIHPGFLDSVVALHDHTSGREAARLMVAAARRRLRAARR